MPLCRDLTSFRERTGMERVDFKDKFHLWAKNDFRQGAKGLLVGLNDISLHSRDIQA